jgi:small subunit ribosomal protein S16
MAVKIRLQRHGRKKAPFYHIVIADARAPRDGKFIEKIGTYNPMTVPATIDIDRDAAYSWLTKGAQPTDTVAAILRFKGVMFRKHLMRGVAKGSLTEEQATEKYNAFLETKEKKVSDRFAQTIENKKKVREQVFGTPKAPKPVAVPVVEEVAPEVIEAPVEEVVEAVVVETPVAEAVVVEAPVAEVVETVVVEAPVAEVVEAVAPEVVEAPVEVVAEAPVASVDPEVATMEAAAEGEEPAA